MLSCASKYEPRIWSRLVLDYPGAAGTQGFGINDHGSVIGIYSPLNEAFGV